MAATIHDVADRAQVSISTVSRAVNRPYLVNSQTRKRVEAAIKLLAYRPNVHAQSLMNGRSDLPRLSARRRKRA